MTGIADVVKLRSTPETVSWGWIAADRAPVLRVKSGETVRVDTVTHQGINNKDDPVTFSPGVEVPLAPFMGIVAVAPPPELKRVSTKPPGAFGGNLDFKHLVAGSTLYLPVFNEGALFYTGDGHACQGDGEVDGTAIEISLVPTVQLIVHQDAGRSMKWPRAEDAANYYSMGMADTLDGALREAIGEAVAFLRARGMTAAEAYALCSLAVDFRIGEAVNNVLMVYGVIPRRLFKAQ